MNSILRKTIVTTGLTGIVLSAAAQKNDNIINVNAAKITSTIQPTMWGVFFEDINMGADGGLYAELVKNRSFEFDTPLMGWKMNGGKVKEGDFLVLNRKAADSVNPRFLRVNVHDAQRAGDMSITNEGFRGMGIKKGVDYNFSVLYSLQKTGVILHVELIDSTGKIVGSTSLTPNDNSEGWHRAEASFAADATVMKAKMRLWFEGNGVIDLDMISLFPSDTWKGRKGGLRADMVQLLADMKPGFIRFPGGCIVEGRDLSQRYQWKKTIGPVEDRQLSINRWNTEFAHRLTPDYYQTFGLGFYEYFQLAEDIGASPLPILNAGMACQFNTAELVPVSQIDPYVQDALDLIEFANGDANTRWGKVRAEMGHPAPFNLKMMGIGNENWGPQYLERLKIFTKAIKDKYPDILLVNSSGTDPNGERFQLLNDSLRKWKADIIDEHYYRRPEWFFQNAKRYDSYDPNGSKVFAGEYAAQSDKTVSVDNKNNWLTALSEAAFMTGLERNADVVYMASYAPLFAHIDAWQWTPDLIWVNNLQAYGTTDYQVQKLYALHKGTNGISILQNGEEIAGKDSLYATAAIDKNTNELIIKLVNAQDKPQVKQIQVDGKKLAANGKLITLQSDDLNAMNSFENPMNVSPKEDALAIKGKQINLTLKPYSFTIVKVKML
ncbi:alpha-L-arabinofuranosidase [Ilyomonas limi]|uniref:non-reducing end alpha-L-arabinofuranosidase n=1 Tax=Ilyomonas limi TaxID=2575867 RepID=A0A4V5UTV9_9BACT|nr:alpha-L-arabinofuranosidase C-terminal domain-containing protein [Ilyomonas limi]TKK64783.1 alpha-L-arabinofuranosidase [Ilyomonas limi]